jgi:hypothetical protein
LFEPRKQTEYVSARIDTIGKNEFNKKMTMLFWKVLIDSIQQIIKECLFLLNPLSLILYIFIIKL